MFCFKGVSSVTLPTKNYGPGGQLRQFDGLPPYFGLTVTVKVVTVKKNKNRLPPKNYRYIALPLNNYRHLLVLPFPPKSLPSKKGKSVYRRKITAISYYRSLCVRLIKRYRGILCFFRSCRAKVGQELSMPATFFSAFLDHRTAAGAPSRFSMFLSVYMEEGTNGSDTHFERALALSGKHILVWLDRYLARKVLHKIHLKSKFSKRKTYFVYIESVPSLSARVIAYRWRSLPRVRRHGASSPQGSSSNGCCLLRFHQAPIVMPLSFPTLTIGMK